MMEIPNLTADKVVSAISHEGRVLVFTEYGKVFEVYQHYSGGGMNWVVRTL